MTVIRGRSSWGKMSTFMRVSARMERMTVVATATVMVTVGPWPAGSSTSSNHPPASFAACRGMVHGALDLRLAGRPGGNAGAGLELVGRRQRHLVALFHLADHLPQVAHRLPT